MSRGTKISLHCPTTVAVGNPAVVADLSGKVARVSGTFVATLALEGTIDGTNWDVIQAALAAGGVHDIARWYHQVRLNVSAFTSGQPIVWVGGFDEGKQ